MTGKPKDIIATLNSSFKIIVGEGFQLHENDQSYNLIKYSTHGEYSAINRIDNRGSEVMVYHWFDEFYLYIEIRFSLKYQNSKKKTNNLISQIFISTSVFKKFEDDIVQLFRAEWDDFEEENIAHPQPHWHFTYDRSIANTFEQYIADWGEDGFVNTSKYKEEILSLKKIHFAMNGRWNENISNAHISKIENAEQLRLWFSGLLNSIRTELEYIGI